MQDNVGEDGFDPPKARASACVPAPAKLHLEIIKALPADHVEPLYSSVLPTPAVPPKASPAF